MAGIEDKYGGKGPQIRSRFMSRSKDKAIASPTPSGLSEQQKREIAKEEYRANPENKGQISNLSLSSTNIGLNIINNLIIDSAKTNTLISLVSLQKGDSLNSIIINNYNGSSAAATVGLHWSHGDQSRLTPSITSGVVTVTKGAELICLFSGSIPYLAGVDLSEMLKIPFTDVSKPIYFYIVSSIAGPTITYSTTSV